MRGHTSSKSGLAAASSPAVGVSSLRDRPPVPPLQLRPVPQVRILRWSLALTQEEFATQYGIGLATLREWEQGLSAPDPEEAAFLAEIGRNP